MKSRIAESGGYARNTTWKTDPVLTLDRSLIGTRFCIHLGIACVPGRMRIYAVYVRANTKAQLANGLANCITPNCAHLQRCRKGAVFTLFSYSTETSCRCRSTRETSPALHRPACTSNGRMQNSSSDVAIRFPCAELGCDRSPLARNAFKLSCM